jgi:NDP-sugar pyrophosphorylase family protein
MRSVAIACSTEEEARSVRHWLDRRYSSHPSRPHVIVISSHQEQPTEGMASARIVAQAFHQGLGSDFDFAEDVIVMHGNLVSDVQLEAVVAAHRLRKATATVMLARPRDEQIQLKSSSKKGGALKPVPSKKTKAKPKIFVGLDTEGDREHLCLWMSENSQKMLPNGKRQPLRQLQIPRKVLKSIPHVNISSNLMNPEVAVFSRDVFDEKISLQGLHSVSEDLIPFLVKSSSKTRQRERERVTQAQMAGGTRQEKEALLLLL